MLVPPNGGPRPYLKAPISQYCGIGGFSVSIIIGLSHHFHVVAVNLDKQSKDDLHVDQALLRQDLLEFLATTLDTL